VIVAVPVEPDAPDARDLLLDELSDPAYAESQPTWFDLLSQAVIDWIANIRFGEGGAFSPVVLVILLVLLIVAVLTAILIYGLPRWRRRSALSDELFGERDRRTARQLRRDAERAASAGDWATAIAERYRAIARALDERTIVVTLPGTTAHGFATAAGRQFGNHAATLQLAADRFDDVRYLGQPGDAAGYALVRELDDAIDRAPSPLPSVGELTPLSAVSS
jgi:type II secretory pathway pseudopilin PulG